MEYPTLNVKQKYRQMADAFQGYNHNLRIGDNEFYDMKNMTSDHYPVLAPRGARGTFIEGNINGIIAKEKLCYVDGTAFVMGEDRVDMGLDTAESQCPKQLVSMGSFVIIMPDRKWINTIKSSKGEYEHGHIDATAFAKGPVEFRLCTITGEDFGETTVAPEAPENPKNNQLWMDTSSTPHGLKKYSSSSAMWVSIASTYIKISSPGIGKDFQAYDGVEITGIEDERITGLNGNHVLQDCGEDYIIITGILDEVIALPAPDSGSNLIVYRKMPYVDFLVEANNRLWGCRYGHSFKNAESILFDGEDVQIVNEIYACKLGDFKNWNCFMGLSTDSYAASVGSDGPFTGATTHLGYPIFFKENCMHKVYGDYPANFQIQHTVCRGVQKGSHKSLATVNETLFYKSGSAVCAYDGSLPVEVSKALGDAYYTDAVAGAHGNKYYITMKGTDGKAHLFAYDTARGMWHKEDNLYAADFCSYQGELYALEHERKKIITMLGSGVKDTGAVPWMVETGLMGMNLPDMKYISRLLLRMSLEIGARVDISIQYDSVGDFENVCTLTSTTLRSFSVPVRLRRCDHFRIRLEGKGSGRIYSITKTIEQGSDVSR